jgi:hypothetical protein
MFGNFEVDRWIALLQATDLDDLDRLEEITSRIPTHLSAELLENVEAREFGSVSSRQPSHRRRGKAVSSGLESSPRTVRRSGEVSPSGPHRRGEREAARTFAAARSR